MPPPTSFRTSRAAIMASRPSSATKICGSDIDNVFGVNSPEHNENLANHDLAVADFEGIVVH